MKARTLNALLANLALVGVLYISLQYEVLLLTYAVAIFIWSMLVSYIAVFLSSEREPKTRPLPAAVTLTIDVVVLALLFSDGWHLSAIAYLTSAILLEIIYSAGSGYGRDIAAIVLSIVMVNIMPILFIVIAGAIVWGFLGPGISLLVVGFFVVWYAIAMYNGPRMAARNAVFAALTCRELGGVQLASVDAKVAEICHRLRINPDSLGPAFPLAAPLATELEKRLFNEPINVYSLRALAMHELGIPPVGTKVPKWYIVRNPFWATSALTSVRRYRREILNEHGVDLVELDRETYNLDTATE